MDTVERVVANDPRPDAGLGRLSQDQHSHRLGSTEKGRSAQEDLESGQDIGGEFLNFPLPPQQKHSTSREHI